MTIEKVRSEDLSTWTLEELDRVIQEEGALFAESLASAVEHAIRAGEALIAAKELVQPGRWLEWIDEHVDGGRGRAERYMRFARNAEILYGALDENADLSVRQANELLKGLPYTGTHAMFAYPPEVIEEAQRLREAGVSGRKIAAQIGVSHTTILRWFTPGYYERSKASQRRYKARDRKARALLKQQQKMEARQEAATKAGGDKALSYSRIRLVLEALESVATNETDRELQAVWREAMGFAYKAEDKIVEALGVS